jgi:hypothetical protein
VFLLSKRLQGQPILGVEFISRNKMVLDIGNSRCYFDFAPEVYITIISVKGHSLCSQTTQLPLRLPHVRCGKLTAYPRGKLERLIHKYPDVLTEKLGLTHLLQYEI